MRKRYFDNEISMCELQTAIKHAMNLPKDLSKKTKLMRRKQIYKIQ